MSDLFDVRPAAWPIALDTDSIEFASDHGFILFEVLDDGTLDVAVSTESNYAWAVLTETQKQSLYYWLRDRFN
jgi:hypothetical protein